jgi:uncharacterized protein (DUF58 family)
MASLARDAGDDSTETDRRRHTAAGSLSRFYTKITPRGRGMLLLLAVTLLLAIATGEGVLYSVSYFLTLIIVGSYVCVRLKLRRLDMRMQNKSYVAQVGDTLKWHVHVCNNSRLPTGCVEIVQMSNMPGGVSGIATTIRAWGQKWLEMHTVCRSRGVYTIGPLLARASDPLGLFRVQIIQGNRIKVVIQPPVVELPYFRIPSADRSGEETARHRSRTRTPHVSTIREYIQGDSLNQIHWLSTAKSGHLMSKEFDSGGGNDVWIVLDLEREIHCSQGTDRTDEYAVAVAASLTNLVLREGHSVGLIACGDHEYLVPLRAGSRQMSSVLDTLTLSKTVGHKALAKVLAENARQCDRSASLIVVTSSTATEWVSVLRELRYHSLNIVVVLVDPASFGGKESLDEVVSGLAGIGIPAYVVRRGDPLPCALSQSIASADPPTSRQYSKPEQIPACEK